MNARPVIAISQRVDRWPARAGSRDALDPRLTGWAAARGALAVPVPNTLGDDLPQWLDAMRPTALLLSGGNDLGDRRILAHLDVLHRADGTVQVQG